MCFRYVICTAMLHFLLNLEHIEDSSSYYAKCVLCKKKNIRTACHEQIEDKTFSHLGNRVKDSLILLDVSGGNDGPLPSPGVGHKLKWEKQRVKCLKYIICWESLVLNQIPDDCYGKRNGLSLLCHRYESLNIVSLTVCMQNNITSLYSKYKHIKPHI